MALVKDLMVTGNSRLNTLYTKDINATGNLIIQNTNPYVKFIDTANGNYVSYVQGYNGKTYLGSTPAKSLCVDSSGNVSIPGSLTLAGEATFSYDATKDAIKITFN